MVFFIHRQTKSTQNAYTVKMFADNYYELVVHKREIPTNTGGYLEQVNDEKLDNNLSRARSRVFELAMCNPFSHFFTGTLADEKVEDRYNLDESYKRVSQFYRNIGKKNDEKIKYLVIPETHKDGAWHFHGLMAGIPKQSMAKFPPWAPKYLRENGYLNWPDYADRFGWCSLAPIRDKLAVSKYITKYVTKSLVDPEVKKRLKKHTFYHSNKLKSATVIQKGTILGGIIPDCHLLHENDYVLKYSFTDKEIGTMLFKLYHNE